MGILVGSKLRLKLGGKMFIYCGRGRGMGSGRVVLVRLDGYFKRILFKRYVWV